MHSHLTTMQLMSALFNLLGEWCAPSVSCHGCLLDVSGIGVLIQGEAAVGKSEAALGLIERGHRLISDDIVKLKKRGNSLEGFGVDKCRHHMEVKGIGIVNILNLFGMASVCEKKSLDIVVKLEVWNDSHFYDRNGLIEKTISFLGVEVPFHVVHVKPGRDVVLLLETLALTHRLKCLSERECKGCRCCS